jgi:hypothetical protein
MTDSYRTDIWIKTIFEDWFDPCPFNPMWCDDFDDGLELEWPNKTFVNPPYSNPKPWIQKAIKENKMFNKSIAMLLKHDTSTKWYKLIHESKGHILLVNERLKHRTGSPAAFPSMIVVWEKLE